LIVVLDYGMGNLPNVVRAVRHLGFDCRIATDLSGASKAILPGVGAFGAAMRRLEPLRAELERFVERGGPLLGICLGQQLLFERSEELGEHEGLGFLRGTVRYFPKLPGLKVPHMGWNEIRFVKDTPMAAGFPEGGQVYFVHSLFTECSEPEDVAAVSEHGVRFAAAVCRGNLWGMQFHPEKSGSVGLALLRRFLEW
jgi:glutamine amidotransferase